MKIRRLSDVTWGWNDNNGVVVVLDARSTSDQIARRGHSSGDLESKISPPNVILPSNNHEPSFYLTVISLQILTFDRPFAPTILVFRKSPQNVRFLVNKERSWLNKPLASCLLPFRKTPRV